MSNEVEANITKFCADTIEQNGWSSKVVDVIVRDLGANVIYEATVSKNDNGTWGLVNRRNFSSGAHPQPYTVEFTVGEKSYSRQMPML